ncbi:hypothetical protein [Geitlerinema sp. P-1104]|nr:hypothetical protein [Geitlerinema sp. P-1104]
MPGCSVGGSVKKGERLGDRSPSLFRPYNFCDGDRSQVKTPSVWSD